MGLRRWDAKARCRSFVDSEDAFIATAVRSPKVTDLQTNFAIPTESLTVGIDPVMSPLRP
jgi:hypothetical protein